MKLEKAQTAFSLLADLSIDANGNPVCVTAEGRHIRVEVPDLATGLDLVRLGSPRGFYLHRIRRFAETLNRLDLTLSLSVNGKSVARFGRGTGFSLLSLLGLGPTRIRPSTLVRAAASLS